MTEEKCTRHHNHSHRSMDDMDEIEKYMAMSWGSPDGLSKLFLPLSVLILSMGGFLLSIGGFLWLLHVANIIK